MSNQDIRLIQLNNYVRPQLDENRFKDWVLNGKKNSFYQYIIDRNNGSPTNSAINNAYIDLIIGRGLYDKNDSPDFDKLMEIFSKKDLRKIATDLQLFNEFSTQIINKRNRKELPQIAHIEKHKVVPQIEDDEGVIKGYWFCKDWNNEYKNPPVYYPAFGTSKEAIELAVVKPYKAGKDYFPDPDYLAGLPYAEMEEEISNLYINSIKNGLSAGYIINIPDGINLTPEEKDKLESSIKKKLTGSPNASRFILSFNGRDAEITIIPIPQNENVHKQWSYLTEEAKQQICTSHRLISTALVGINNASGFSSTADELDTAEAQLLKRVIQPKQRYITDFLEEFGSAYGLELELDFLPLTEQEEKTENEIVEEKIDEVEQDVEMSKQCDCKKKSELELLLEKYALDTPDGYELTDGKEYEVNLSANQSSEQDSDLWKIRYAYSKGTSKTPIGDSREFCNKMMSLSAQGKVYRKEDIELMSMQGVNGEFAHTGGKYDIFKFAGGVNCYHRWERRVFKKKLNADGTPKKGNAMQQTVEVNVNDAKRQGAKLPKNHKDVAIAEIDKPNKGRYPN